MAYLHGELKCFRYQFLSQIFMHSLFTSISEQLRPAKNNIYFPTKEMLLIYFFNCAVCISQYAVSTGN